MSVVDSSSLIMYVLICSPNLTTFFPEMVLMNCIALLSFFKMK